MTADSSLVQLKSTKLIMNHKKISVYTHWIYHTLNKVILKKEAEETRKKKKTTLKIQRFANKSCANVTTDDHSQLAFFFQLSEEQTFQTIVNHTDEHARKKSNR